jgi:hypothetical protein
MQNNGKDYSVQYALPYVTTVALARCVQNTRQLFERERERERKLVVSCLRKTLFYHRDFKNYRTY